jgi:hypothetical protein
VEIKFKLMTCPPKVHEAYRPLHALRRLEDVVEMLSAGIPVPPADLDFARRAYNAAVKRPQPSKLDERVLEILEPLVLEHDLAGSDGTISDMRKLNKTGGGS